MLKTALVSTAIAITSLIGFSNSASAVVLGNFNDASDNEGWTRTTSLGMTNQVVPSLGVNAIGNASSVFGFPLPGSASLSKTTTVGLAGDIINLSFDLGSLIYGGSGVLNFLSNGINLASYNTSSPPASANQMLSFTSIGADNYSFNYSGTPNSGFSLDNIEAVTSQSSTVITPTVPEPEETAGLVLFGAAAIILKRKLDNKAKSV